MTTALAPRISAAAAAAAAAAVVIDGADYTRTQKLCAALSRFESKRIVSVASTSEGVLELEVVTNTLYADLFFELNAALGEETDFVVQAPEDHSEEAPLVLTRSGWRYQMICGDCGVYTDDTTRAIIDHVCDSCFVTAED